MTALPAASRRQVVVVLVSALVVGLLVGFVRGCNGTDLGTQGPSVAITAPPQPVTGPTTPPAPVMAPDVELTTVNFDDGLPRDVNFQTVVYDETRWVGARGQAIVTEPGVPGPTPEAAPPYDAARDWIVNPGKAPLNVVEVELVAPAPHAGVIARFQDADNYFAVLADKDLTHVELIEVRDGEATTRGFVDHLVTPGTRIGFVAVGNEVSLSIDGKPQVLSTFFGNQSTVSDHGLTATGLGLMAGSGQPVFDDLVFG